MLVCLSGIVCYVYECGIVLIVYLYYVFGVVDMLFEKFIFCVISDVWIMEKFWKVDVVIWDEVSMFSVWMLEFVNVLYYWVYECDGEENKMFFVEI